jgi:hypothetical protein
MLFHLLYNMKSQNISNKERNYLIFLIKLRIFSIYIPDKQEYTYYDQQFEQHYLNFHLFLHHAMFHHFQFLDRLYLLFLVVYHEHKFHNQHQAKQNNFFFFFQTKNFFHLLIVKPVQYF